MNQTDLTPVAVPVSEAWRFDPCTLHAAVGALGGGID